MARRVSCRMALILLLTAWIWALSFPVNALGQSGTSSVHGTVLDPQGQVITGASVSLTNEERNFLRTQKSNESGGYAFTAVPPGLYRIEVEVLGFRKLTIEEVRALVDTPSIVDLHLEIGEITLSVTVTAEGTETQLNTQDATIGHNFVGQQITQLPLESRNVVELLSLQPGVTPSGYVNGSRADQANITLDGVDVNEQQTGLDIVEDLAFDRDVAFASVLRATPDSLQEFRVTVSNPNATQGRSSGGQVSLITKSGTNDIHGSLYEFHRNTVTTANDFFNNRSIDPETGRSIPRPALIRNVFGGSVGGPIKKNRAFFFYTYEGRRDATESTVVRPVPLPSLGRGEVRFLNTNGGITTLSAADINNLFPGVGVNPVGLSYLADAARRYPANDDTFGDGLNTAGFRFNAPTPLDFNTHIAKVDFNLTQDGRHLLSLRGNYQSDVVTGVSQFPDTPASRLWSHPVGFAASYTWSISANKVNSFRYGLTRAAFANQGDSVENNIDFRFVYNPRRNDPLLYTLDRVTPVHNLVDDFTWTKGNHNLQLGTNIRLIRNRRTTFSTSFDAASANASVYENSGAVLSDPISGIDPSFTTPVNNAVSAVIGRLSDYVAHFNFDRNGNLLPFGAGIGREFATEEYDWYVQDVWKLRPSLTLTAGLRYGLSRPVYETQGFQVKPTTSLGTYFERRKAGAAIGQPLNDPITVDVAGPANNRPGFYEWDKNNFQPRAALAWSPSFENGTLRKLFGSRGTSVFRGGFGITNDYYGQQLAVQFDLNNALGFASNTQIPPNTYNVSDNPPPLFTNFGQDIRSLPGITTPGNLTFPLTVPSDESQRVESSLDDTLRTPIHYNWNFSFERQLPAGLHFEASYVGRAARKLLLTRDIMALNNLVDPGSHTDWYTAAGILADLRAKNTAISAVGPIAYFENLFPGLGNSLLGDPSLTPTQAMYTVVAREQVGGFNSTDWTSVQLAIDDLSSVGPNAFFHPQYAALATFSTVGHSDYHAGSFSLRKSQTHGLSFDFNYTFAKSMDDASGLQNSTAYGSAFILNPLKQDDGRSVSDFDIRHNINVNAIWELPFGQGKRFLANSSGLLDAILGGWQLSTISRWHSGLPIELYFFDTTGWATNWQIRSKPVRARPLESSPTRGGERPPNLFSDPVSAYQSFRNPRAGEGGDRNVFRIPSFITLDFGLGKSFKMPWSENHRLQFRWEVFNATNTQQMGLLTDSIDALGVGIDPDLNQPAPAFGNFNAIQGQPRVMQFGLRYSW
jgi:Carboxypeptidase regulatory-like domain